MVAARRTLTVKHDGKDTTFQINDKSEVMKGKSKADRVRAGGERRARP